jgi:tetratricopeptide (TPR) repeat protein
VNRRSSYKVTLLDKYGPEAMRYYDVAKWGLVVFVLSGVMFYFVAAFKLGLMDPALTLWTLVAALTLSAASMLFSLKLSDSAGDGAAHVYMGGSSTPYEDNFSQEQALVMQRDYAGALHLYEQRILLTPKYGKLLIAAADLYGTLGENHKRAAELYKEVQKLEDLEPGQDIYVSNKLADLFLYKLGEPGRALVEFRRLMSRYPGTVAGKNAKLALDNLKPDLVKEPDAAPEPKPDSRVW